MGGWRDSTASTVYVGWHWVDGADASNLNCGVSGCGVFSTGQPKYVVLPSRVVAGILIGGKNPRIERRVHSGIRWLNLWC